jgi:hypothetical protein
MNSYINSKIYVIILVFISFGCKDDVVSTHQPRETYPPENRELVSIQQGLWGNVWLWEGDFMPMGWGNITPVSRTIYFYQLTPYDSVEPPTGTWFKKIKTVLIDSTVSGSNGFFQIKLAPNEYSVFVKEDTAYYANWFTIRGGNWYILPVPVKKDSVTKFQIDLTYKATF